MTDAEPAGLPSLTSTGRARAPHDELRIAHRAIELAGPDPERACRTVRSAGAHLVEVDVRITLDDRLVVAHDPWAADPGGERRWIADLPMDIVVAEDPLISPLTQVLSAIRRCGMGVYLDVKSISRAGMGRLSDALRAASLWRSSIIASSRSDIVALSAELVPDIPRSVLFASDTEDPVQLAASVAAQYVHPCWERFASPQDLLTAEWVRRVRQRGLGIISWHEERSDVLTDLVGMGVDGICTDDLPLLVDRVAAGDAQLGRAGGNAG